MTNFVGELLGNYRLLRVLGRGGSAEVYLAEHIYLKTLVAVKVLNARLDREDMEHLIAEAQLNATLEHPHIVRVLECGVAEGIHPYLVMNYAPGGTIRRRYPRGSQLPLSLIAQYVRQVASALQFVHEMGHIHRDVKPENMLLGRNDEVLLSDFGIATIIHRTFTGNIQNVAGTALYVAPEQLQGKPRPASDQYSLGIMVYEWLSGECPFRGTVMLELCGQHLFMPPPSLKEKVPWVSSAVEDVVMKALAKDPQQRFANVRLFAEALEQAIVAPQRTFSSPLVASAPLSSLSQDVMAAVRAPVSSPLLAFAPPTPLPVQTLRQHEEVQTPRPFLRNKAKKSRHVSMFGLIALLFLLLVVVIGGGVLFYYEAALQVKAPLGQTSASTQASARLQAKATVTAAQRIYTQATSGVPTFSASLASQDGNSWNELTYPGGGGCEFTSGAYHATMLQPGFVALCLARASDLTNFAFQVQMTVVRGARGDGGGLIFRASDEDAAYRFHVSADGTYDLVYQNRLITAGSSSAIQTELNQTNLLTVVAEGNTLYLYVNKHYLASVYDISATSGKIGVLAVSFTRPTDVAFSNAEVWRL